MGLAVGAVAIFPCAAGLCSLRAEFFIAFWLVSSWGQADSKTRGLRCSVRGLGLYLEKIVISWEVVGF